MVLRKELLQNAGFLRDLDAGLPAASLRRKHGRGESEGNWRTVCRELRSERAAGKSALPAPPPDFESDKKEDTFHWRKACGVVQQMQALSKEASTSQDEATIKFSGLEKPIVVWPISDWHFGSYGSDYGAIEEMTDYIVNTDNLYIAVVGDMLQMAIKMRGVLEMMDNALPPKLQMKFLDTWINDVAHKILFASFDNHSVIREENATGFSEYANKFGKKCIYHNGIGHTDIVANEQVYKVAVSHRFRGSSFINPVHGLCRYLRMEAPDREIAIQGDTHVPAFMQYPEGGSLRTVINCGTLQTNSGYGKRFFSLKTWTDFPALVLFHDRHKVLPFWKVEDALEAAH